MKIDKNEILGISWDFKHQVMTITLKKAIVVDGINKQHLNYKVPYERFCEAVNKFEDHLNEIHINA